ncbi:MAG: amidohydrolase family protein [Marinomonas sp.]
MTSCAALPEPIEVPQEAKLDLLIKGGLIYDGLGAQGRIGDIGIAENKIVFVGEAHSEAAAKQTLDAADLIVAPGFIDPHTHADKDLVSQDRKRRANLPYLFQGVTTVVVGNDGFGGSDIAAQAQTARARGIGTNAVYLAGFGPLRESVLGKQNRSPQTAELELMKAKLERAMCEGAAGFSAGLYYAPQNFAKTDEVAALAAVAGEHGGYYDTHMRDESDYSIGLERSVAEALAIGKRAQIPVHIAHIKALGPSVWGRSKRIIDMISAARATGQSVTADQYPWEASGTRISNAIVPRWALDGGLEGLRLRLKEPVTRAKIAEEMEANLKRRGGAERLLFTGSLGAFKAKTGQTLSDYSQAQGMGPVEAAIGLLQQGDMRVASFVMNTQDINALAVQPWVATGSDGSTGHPRKYASFPKAYRDLVVDEKLLSMAQFIRRSTALPAQILGLKDRGALAAGMAADVAVFDPRTFRPNATYAQPKELSSGAVFVIVNGKLAITEGQYSSELAGQPLLRAGRSAHADCAMMSKPPTVTKPD